jgi:hypothetical protein
MAQRFIECTISHIGIYGRVNKPLIFHGILWYKGLLNVPYAMLANGTFNKPLILHSITIWNGRNTVGLGTSRKSMFHLLKQGFGTHFSNI